MQHALVVLALFSGCVIVEGGPGPDPLAPPVGPVGPVDPTDPTDPVGPSPSPVEVGDATLAIGIWPGWGVQPGTDQPLGQGEGWLSVVLNYPGFDCSPVNRYQDTLPVLRDETAAAFEGWLQAAAPEAVWDIGLVLQRESPEDLWHVVEWFDADAPPVCYPL